MPTFRIYFLANTTKSRILDRSVTTIHVEKSIASSHRDTTEDYKSYETSSSSPWAWSAPSGFPSPISHLLQLLPCFLRIVRHRSGLYVDSRDGREVVLMAFEVDDSVFEAPNVY